MVVLTVVAVVRGVATHGPADLSAATSATQQVRTPAHDRALSKAAGPGTGPQQQARATATRRPDLSRHAARPSVAPYHVKSGPTLGPASPTVVLARKVADLSPATSTFTIAQSNILGSQHTRGRGGFAPGTVRAGMTAGLLMSRGADVGGMQEVQDDQLRVLQSRMAGYSIWPAAALGNNGVRLQIYWRDSQFEMVDNGSVTYTFASQRIPLPYVLLRDRGTGAEFWVITTHNSAGGLEAQRDSGTAIEINLIHTLMATGPARGHHRRHERAHRVLLQGLRGDRHGGRERWQRRRRLSPPAQPAPGRLDHGWPRDELQRLPPGRRRPRPRERPLLPLRDGDRDLAVVRAVTAYHRRMRIAMRAGAAVAAVSAVLALGACGSDSSTTAADPAGSASPSASRPPPPRPRPARRARRSGATVGMLDTAYRGCATSQGWVKAQVYQCSDGHRLVTFAHVFYAQPGRKITRSDTTLAKDAAFRHTMAVCGA